MIADRDENIKILQIEQISVNILQFTNLELESDLTALTCFNYIYLIIALSNGVIKIWNIAYTQSLITFSSGHQQEITCLISINNLYFATGSMDKSIIIWKTLDYSNYTISSKLTKHKGRINSLLYISKRKYLLSTSSDTSFIIWKHLHDNLTMQKDLENAHSRQINDLIQLRNTNFLVSASDDFTIKIWDTNNRYSNIDVLIGHTSDVYSIIELPHNRFASCSKDKSIIIWNSTDFQLIKYLFAHLGPVISLATIGDQYLASGSCDSTIIIWILTNEYQVKAIWYSGFNFTWF